MTAALRKSAARAARPRVAHADSRLPQILDAAAHLFCTQGYQGTKKRTTSELSDPKANTAARCTAPRGSATSVRGAQNAPGPSSSTNSTVPFAFGDQPVSPGLAASLGMTTPQVSVPLPPSGGESGEASWLWIMKEAAR